MSRLSRRGILGGAAAAALVPAVGVGASLPPADLDAVLMQLYAQHARNHAAVNALPGVDLENEHHPVWVAYDVTYAAVRDSRPQTMAGVLAKARAAQMEEFVPQDGDEECNWAALVVRDLLRLAGG